MTISFQVHGLPKGQPRARAFAQRFGNKFSARMYDPGTADEWKEQVYLALKRELDRLQVTPTLGAVRMTLTFSMPRPKAHYGKRGLKEKAPKGTSSQTQGESIRVTAKKRDALQDVIAMLKAEDVGIPLQFQNFRD